MKHHGHYSEHSRTFAQASTVLDLFDVFTGARDWHTGSMSTRGSSLLVYASRNRNYKQQIATRDNGSLAKHLRPFG